MAEQQTQSSIWQKLARERWPQSPVSGDGPIAIFDGATGAVTLFDFYMLAKQTQRAGPYRQMWHLRSGVPKEPEQVRVWERD